MTRLEIESKSPVLMANILPLSYQSVSAFIELFKSATLIVHQQRIFQLLSYLIRLDVLIFRVMPI